MAKWYFSIEGHEEGPIGPDELRRLVNSGRLKRDDKVRREDMTDWRPAQQIKGLFTAAASKDISSLASTPPNDATRSEYRRPTDMGADAATKGSANASGSGGTARQEQREAACDRTQPTSFSV